MTTLYPMTQLLFVNQQTETPAQQGLLKEKKGVPFASPKLTPIEGEFMRIGDSISFGQAENLFTRANQYAELTNNAQNGLHAYTSIDVENKREALRQLMGVDLYA